MTLGKKDKAVIAAFVDCKAAVGHKLSTDGHHLNGHWMGGSNIAEWAHGPHGRHIWFHDLGSRAAQTVQRAVAKAAPASYLATYRKVK